MNRDQISPYALTTLQRVKDRIFDTGGVISLTGTTNATVTISGVTIPTGGTPPGLTVGQSIYGTGIPFGAYITAIGANSLTINVAATSSTSNLSLSVPNQPTQFDNVLIRFINSVSNWIARACGDRKFVQTLIQNEVYSAYGALQKYMVSKQCPINYFMIQGNLTQSSPIVTGISNTAGIQVGMPVINCAELPPGVITYVKSVDSTTQITLTNNATNTATDVMQIIGLVSFQWRAGTPNAPNWTAFVPDQYELVEDGRAGIIRLYGVMPRLYNNMARITYWCGYLVNWALAGDGVTHTLPSELTNACENIVVRFFKRRADAGRLSEALDGATTSWDKEIDSQDREAIEHHKQVPSIF